MSDKVIRYNVMLNAKPLKNHPKFAPVVTVKNRDEAYLIAYRLNGRSRGEDLYKVEKVIEEI